MSILGFSSTHSIPSELQSLRTVAAELGEPNQRECTDRNSFFVTAQDSATEGDLVVAYDGMPRYDGDPVDAAGLLVLARKYGPGFIERLAGSFAIFLHDTKNAMTILAVDKMGIERITYAVTSIGLCFGQKATSVRKISGLPAPVRDQGIYDYLFFHMLPSPNTIFENILKLPPAHMLEWKDGKISSRRYWKPSFHSNQSYNFRELQSELDELLESAVRSTDPGTKSGAFLSGGLDSSTIAGYLGQVVGKEIDTFSIGFGVDEFDEMKYARLSASHFKCRGHEYTVTADDIQEVFQKVAQSYDEPFGNSSVIPTYFCARLAADAGITHLLAGDGGDELFGGNERYAKQKVFELYGRIPGWLRSGLIYPVSQRFSAESSLLPFRKIRRYVDQACVPLPDRLGGNFAFNVGLSDMLSPEFARSIDSGAPLEHMRQVYQSTVTDSTLNNLLAYDWRLTLADNDLRKVGTMCELAGVRVSYPFLHDELVDFSTRIPASRKLRRLELRTFFKQAMGKFLPPEVINKSKHGFGLPFGVWLQTDKQLGELIYSNLSDMNSRRIFKQGFIDDVIQQHKSGSASYFGNFIWDLAMLEEWMKFNQDTTTNS